MAPTWAVPGLFIFEQVIATTIQTYLLGISRDHHEQFFDIAPTSSISKYLKNSVQSNILGKLCHLLIVNQHWFQIKKFH